MCVMVLGAAWQALHCVDTSKAYGGSSADQARPADMWLPGCLPGWRWGCIACAANSHNQDPLAQPCSSHCRRVRPQQPS